MLRAFFWGLVSTSSLVIGGLRIPEGGSVSLAMLANSMRPEAFENGGKIAGLLRVLGFTVAVAVALIERAG
ncbi:MAG: hypothetical protein GWP63_12055 [Haliea sp.]|jgi:hypothetical protein|nr:hypothetical protein [Haliea sp.]